MKTILLMLFVIILVGCGSLRVKERQSSTMNQIAFMCFEVKQDSTCPHPIFQLQSAKYVTGQFKANDDVSDQDNYQMVFKDKLSNEIGRIRFSNPLHQRVEYGTDNNIIVSQELTLNKAEFPIRANLSGIPQKILIFHIEDQKTELIQSINLK